MRRIAFLAALLAPLPALAHPGGEHVHGLLAGLAHPFGGPDHLAATLAVGRWAGLVGGRAMLALPAAFLLGVVAGGALGVAGVALPLVEGGILASVVVLGAAAGLVARVPAGAAAALVALAGLLHGHAHGTGTAAGALASGAGMLAATGLLLGLGLLAVWRAEAGRRTVMRLAGGATSLAGVLLAIV